MALPQRTHWTPDDYLAFERDQHDTRHELIDGEIFAMSGASMNHNQITSNLHIALVTQLQDSSCRIFQGDMRVKISHNCVYPDLVMVCGRPQLLDEYGDNLLNPTLIIEVLSPSAERYDRGLKFQKYQELSTLKTYVLVEQSQKRVERYQRQTDSTWLLTTYTQDDVTLDLPAINASLSIAEVYRLVEFPEA